jgi:hypothetical protein
VKDDGSQPPPDFAMTRAVEILANIYQRGRPQPDARPQPFDRVVQIFSETIAFDVTRTTRRDVELALGIAFAYPVRGWHTYCVRGHAPGSREFVSLFYQSPHAGQSRLISAELYLPKVDRAPALEPRDLRYRLIPGEVTLGMPVTALPEAFSPIRKPAGLGPYDAIFEARFPGGSAYAMGTSDSIERLAIYGLRAEDGRRG